MKRIYTAILFTAVILMLSLVASAQGHNGASNGTTQNRMNSNGAPNGTQNAGQAVNNRTVSLSIDPAADAPKSVQAQRKQSLIGAGGAGTYANKRANANAIELKSMDRDNMNYIYGIPENARTSYNMPVGTKETSYNMCATFRTLNQCK